MKSRFLPIILFVIAIVINACSPFTIARSSTSYQAPAPIVEMQSTASGYQPVVVDDVQVDVGVGSPIPVNVRVAGVLPDQCSQIEYSTIKQDGTNFIIELSAIPGGSECMKDTLPFIISIPLNVVYLPAGAYSATVNGVRADFTLQTGTPAHDLREADQPFVKRDIQVQNVTIVVGPGSPLPVHAIVSGDLPNACAWLGEIRLHRDKNTYFVQLLSYLPAESKCDPDPLPFRLELPLNTVNLPDGSYSVNVNGTVGGFPMPLVSEALQPQGWSTFTSQQCEYMISYPSEMQATDQSPYGATFRYELPDPDQGARNFIYLSVISPEIQRAVQAGAYQHEVYNYDPAATDILLDMQVGATKSVHSNPNLVSGFVYQRQPDTTISGYAARSYENLQPWEFPAGTKEIRYYVTEGACTYLLGGYVDTTGSSQPGAITEDLFHQVMGTLQLMP